MQDPNSIPAPPHPHRAFGWAKQDSVHTFTGDYPARSPQSTVLFWDRSSGSFPTAIRIFRNNQEIKFFPIAASEIVWILPPAPPIKKIDMIYLATSFCAVVSGLQACWDNSVQLTRFASQTCYKKYALCYAESVLRCLGKTGSIVQNSGGKRTLQVRNALKAEAFLSKDKPNLLISLRKQLSGKFPIWSKRRSACRHAPSPWFSWEQGHRGKNSLQQYKLFVNWVTVSESEGSLHLTAGAVW